MQATEVAVLASKQGYAGLLILKTDDQIVTGFDPTSDNVTGFDRTSDKNGANVTVALLHYYESQTVLKALNESNSSTASFKCRTDGMAPKTEVENAEEERKKEKKEAENQEGTSCEEDKSDDLVAFLQQNDPTSQLTSCSQAAPVDCHGDYASLFKDFCPCECSGRTLF